MRIAVGLAMLVLLQACSSTPATKGIARQPDALCVNDCLGAGGTAEFCQSRCSD